MTHRARHRAFCCRNNVHLRGRDVTCADCGAFAFTPAMRMRIERHDRLWRSGVRPPKSSAECAVLAMLNRIVAEAYRLFGLEGVRGYSVWLNSHDYELYESAVTFVDRFAEDDGPIRWLWYRNLRVKCSDFVAPGHAYLMRDDEPFCPLSGVPGAL
jgi:hypothetical protein